MMWWDVFIDGGVIVEVCQRGGYIGLWCHCGRVSQLWYVIVEEHYSYRMLLREGMQSGMMPELFDVRVAGWHNSETVDLGSRVEKLNAA